MENDDLMSKEIFTVRMEKSILGYIKGIIKKKDGREIEDISNYEAAKFAMNHFVMCSDIAVNVATASNGKKYYSVNEVAAILGKPTRTIRDWCKKEKLPRKKFGKQYMIDKAYIDSLSEKPDVDKVE